MTFRLSGFTWFRILALGCCLTLAAFASPAKFDIAAQPAPAALRLFAKQSGVEVLFLKEELASILTNPLSGEMEPGIALNQMIAGTGFMAKQTGPQTYSIARSPKSPGSVEGEVREEKTSRPVVDATVTVIGTDLTTRTDRNGRYRFDDVSAGTHALNISAEGMQRTRITDVLVQPSRLVSLSPVTIPAQVPGVVKMEDYVVSARKNSGVVELDPFEVSDTRAKPFSDRNVDLPRTINDVQPYHIFDSRTIEQSGAMNTEDFLKQRLTMNTNAQSLNQGYANSYGSTSQINLRGLGVGETLILVNGRERAGVSKSTTIGQPDLNGIPLEAIDRIEVLPTSASAIYGGSAMAGVVNVVLKTNYVGGTFKSTYEDTVDTHSPIRSVDLTYGFTLEGGRTQVTVTAHYADGEGLYSKDRREITERGIQAIIRNQTTPTLLVSPTLPFYGATTPNIALYAPAFTPVGGTAYANPSAASLVLKNGTSLNSVITHVPEGTAPGSAIGAGLLANAGRYNTTLGYNTSMYGLNSLVGWAAPRNKTFMATASRKMTSWLEVYGEFSLEGNLAITTYAPITAYRMSGGSPYNPFLQNIYITLPTDLNKPDTNNTVTRTLTGGLKTRLPFGWVGQMDYTRSASSYTLDFVYMDSNGIETALNNGTLNPFADLSRYPLAMEKFVAPGHWDYATTLNDIGLRLSGPVWRWQWGNPTLSLGVKHKRQGMKDGVQYVRYPVNVIDSSNTYYLGHSSTNDAAHAEFHIPIISEQRRIPLVRSFDIQLAGRTDQYEVDTGTSLIIDQYARTPPVTIFSPASPTNAPYSSTSNYDSRNGTAGLKYEPIRDVALRSSYAKAFLPPSFPQLVPNLAPSAALTTITDPKTGSTYGVPTLTGGNPALAPQRSKSFNLGIIYEPSRNHRLHGLRLNLEYYKITQFNYITLPTAQQVVSTPEYANRITRNATTGLISLVNTSYINANQYTTAGWDVSLDYRKQTGVGLFNLHAAATKIDYERRQLTIGGPDLDYVGYVPEGGPAEWKGNTTLTWQKGHLLLGWTTTFFDRYYQYSAPGGPYTKRFAPITTYTAAQGGYVIPSQTYHDLFASYVFTRRQSNPPASHRAGRLLEGLTLQGGVKNVFNAVPPFDAFYGPFYYSPYGSPRLQTYWVSLKKEF